MLVSSGAQGFSHTGSIGRFILGWLDSHPEIQTYKVERATLTLIEILCHVATVIVAPDAWTRSVLVFASVIAFRSTMLQQTQRSAAARKRERMEASGSAQCFRALGNVAPRLRCEAQVERDAADAQALTAISPLVGLAIGVGLAHGHVTAPLIVGAVVAAVRLAWAHGYTAWRRWMRERRPLTRETLP